MKAPHVLIAAILSIASATAGAQLPVAAAADVVAATAACRQATSASAIDEAKLIADGWVAATWTGKGTASAAPMRIFNKGGIKAVVMLPRNATLCIVLSRIPDVATFNATAAALDQVLATPRKRQPDEPNAALWFPPDQLVQLQLTGKPDALGIRVSVMPMSQEKK